MSGAGAALGHNKRAFFQWAETEDYKVILEVRGGLGNKQSVPNTIYAKLEDEKKTDAISGCDHEGEKKTGV